MSSWIGRGVALLAVGAVLFYVAWPKDDEASPAAAPEPSASAVDEQVRDLAEVTTRVNRLEADVLALHSRLDAMRHAHSSDGGVAQAPAGAPSSGMAAWQEALRRMRAGGGASGLPGDGRGRPGAPPGAAGPGQGRWEGADPASGTTAGDRGVRREGRLNEFAARANLSESQSASLRSALQAEREKAKALRESARSQGGDPRSMREEMQRLRAETDAQLKAVLDETQYTEYQELRTQRPHDARGGQGPGGATRGAGMRGGGFGPRRMR